MSQGTLVDLSGGVFGKLTVLRRAPNQRTRHARWLCRCECGNEKSFLGCVLAKGGAKSCGCSTRQMIANGARTHGGRSTSEYSVWLTVKKRCLNPRNHKYPAYGGRGIGICGRWRGSFAGFLADMGPRPSLKHSIDRIDNSKGYEPGNCRWATAKEQSRNRRNIVSVTIGGETKLLVEWAEQIGLSGDAFYTRLRRGDSGERLLRAPRFPKAPGAAEGAAP